MNAGIYYLSNKNIKNFSKEKSSFENDYLKNLILKKTVYGQKFKSELIDIGTVSNYKIAKRILPKTFKKPAVFLERDGVSNSDYGSVNSQSKFKLKKNVLKGLNI